MCHHGRRSALCPSRRSGRSPSAPAAVTPRASTPSSAPWSSPRSTRAGSATASATATTACSCPRTTRRAASFRLTPASVAGITHLGGTILGTTNRGNPTQFPVLQPDGSFIEVDRTDELVERFNAAGLDALITVGGDGSLSIGYALAQQGAARGRRAEDHRQRPRPHVHDVRLRHGRVVRHRVPGPPAHHRDLAPPHHGGRGHGPLRRLDRPARRASPATPTSSSSPRSPTTSRRSPRSSASASARAAPTRSSSWPRARRPVGGEVSVLGQGGRPGREAGRRRREGRAPSSRR